MLFNSSEFMIFFPLVVMGYFILPHKYRWMLLLGASYWFYMAWKPAYVLLILLSTCVDYFAARVMEKKESRQERKKILWVSLAFNLGLLIMFKYANFIFSSWDWMLGFFSLAGNAPRFSLLLPMGISFYTFQTLSYTIDVYYGRRPAEKHFGIFALYVSFFPQLVAGPIERSDRLIPQFYEEKHFDYQRVTDGLKRMGWGLFKKMVIADRVSMLVDTVYGNPTNYSGVQLILATFFFAIQVYCDFSGYTDIAIGAAKVLGYDLMENFKQPYFSASIADFWKRWHISLSTWFRDYVYIPLGGSRVNKGRHYVNLFLTFIISGLWHGANWTFVIWGAYHGLLLILESMTGPLRRRISKGLRLERAPKLVHVMSVFCTFTLVCLGYIFFRAESLLDAGYIFNHLLSDGIRLLNPGYVVKQISDLGLVRMEFEIALIGILILVSVQVMQVRGSFTTWVNARPVFVRWSLYYGLLLGILFFGIMDANEFVYFQF